ncbi:hypothetical protein KR018_007041, partial [Drosophila ironensis]
AMEDAPCTSKNMGIFSSSAWDFLQGEANKITTGNKALDEHLGGGISLGQITELIGNPGTGKTQMCLQLSLNVQIPMNAGGLEGSALFVDTRRDFHPDRLLELAKQLEQQYAHKAPDFKASGMLKNIEYIECPNVAQLMACVLNCSQILENNPNVINPWFACAKTPIHSPLFRQIKLIVIDSLSFALRMLEDGAQQFALLLELHESMRRLQRRHKVAWVVNNVLTHRLANGRYYMVPALGDLHSHLINERIWFSRSWHRYLGKTWSTCRLINAPD